MKVGILTNSYPPNLNGVSRSVVNLEKSLQKLGVEVFIITPKVPGVIYQKNVLTLPSYSAPQKVSTDLQVPYNYIDQTTRFIKKNQIEILHSQDTLIGGTEAVIIAMKCQIPCVHTYHTMVEDYDYFSFPGYKTFIRRYSQTVCDGYDAVVAVSPKTEQYLYKINVQSPIYQIPNVLILPNSPILDSKIDVKSTKEIVNLDLKNSLKNVEQLDTNSKPNKPVKPNNSKQTRSQNLISNSTLQNPKSNKFYFKEKFPNLPIDVENSFNFVTFGRIAKEKSLEIGIEILEPLLQKYPIYYLIAGIGPEMENLESFIKKKNLENKVFLIGKYDNESLSDFCEFCDVFVNTSTSENLPTTDFEALSFGLPVVAIDDLAHRFFVENSNLDFLENLKKKSNQNEWKNNQEKSLALTQKKTHNLTAIFENKLHRKLQDEINWLSLQSKPFAKFLEYIKKTQNKIEIQNQKTFQNWFQSSSKVTLINRQKQKNKTLVGKIHQNNSNSNLGFGLENNSQKKLQNNFISEKFPIEIGAKLSNWTNKNQIWVNKNFPKIAELIQKSQENENWQIGQLNPNIWEKKIKSESLSTNIANLKKYLSVIF